MMSEHNVPERDSTDSGLLQPLASKSVVDRIIDRLTQAIVDRQLKPGQKIPTEIELCESMQVGRNSVREAIKVLVTMGVLEIRRSEGTFVTRGFSERMLDPLVYGLLLEKGDSYSIIELRLLFEAGIIRLAIEKRTEQELRELHSALEQMVDVVTNERELDDVLAADCAFHRVLVKMVKNPLVEKVNVVIERLTKPSRKNATRRLMEANGASCFLSRHQEIVKIIRERDIRSVDSVIDKHFRNWRIANSNEPERPSSSETDAFMAL